METENVLLERGDKQQRVLQHDQYALTGWKTMNRSTARASWDRSRNLPSWLRRFLDQRQREELSKIAVGRKLRQIFQTRLFAKNKAVYPYRSFSSVEALSVKAEKSPSTAFES